MQKTKVEDVNVVGTAPLLSPNDLDEQLPITEEIADHVVRGRAQIEAILNGTDDRLFVIVGPCSIHDEAAALGYAGRLAALAEKLSDRLVIVMGVYFEKPRTTVGWKGFIYDPGLDDSFDINSGITRARALLLKLNEMGIYAATECLDPVVPQYLAEFVTWACIGARTVESQVHRELASGLPSRTDDPHTGRVLPGHEFRRHAARRARSHLPEAVGLDRGQRFARVRLEEQYDELRAVPRGRIGLQPGEIKRRNPSGHDVERMARQPDPGTGDVYRLSRSEPAEGLFDPTQRVVHGQ